MEVQEEASHEEGEVVRVPARIKNHTDVGDRFTVTEARQEPEHLQDRSILVRLQLSDPLLAPLVEQLPEKVRQETCDGEDRGKHGAEVVHVAT